jgi:cytochrome c oxidase cbb3-type subunit 4
MDTYSFLRELADSWVLLAMCVFYFGAIIWAFRPGSRALHADISDIPFRNETLPIELHDTADTDRKGGSNSAQTKPEAR